MSKSKTVPDPGWRPVLRLLPKMFIPFIGMRSMATQPSAITSLRMIWLYLAVVMVPSWAVAFVVADVVEPTWSVGQGAGLAAVVGLATLAANRYAAARVDYFSADSFVDTFPRMTMLQCALVGAAGLGGFCTTVLSGSVVSYAVGFAFACVGLVLAVPNAAGLARAQRAAEADGATYDVVTVLVKNQLGR